MSDSTKSGYTKTGKKVKSINYDRTDLTYNDVYEVFIDSDGDEFIIDDVDDKRYGNIDDDDYYELVDDVSNEVNDTNKPKPKFKVGDKVYVGMTGRIAQVTEIIDDDVVSVANKNNEVRAWVSNICHATQENYERLQAPFPDIKFEQPPTQADIDNEAVEPKFKVGDKVKVVDIGYISQATSDIKVGDVGVIAYVDSDCVMSPYRVEFDDDWWWFTDKCIELVNDDTIENNPTESAPIVSDGGSSSYYAQQIPKGVLERFNATGIIEAKDVIRLFLGNDFNMGNIFKAYCRVISLRNGKGKAGVDEQYDLTKAKFFAEDELNSYLENN